MWYRDLLRLGVGLGSLLWADGAWPGAKCSVNALSLGSFFGGAAGQIFAPIGNGQVSVGGARSVSMTVSCAGGPYTLSLTGQAADGGLVGQSGRTSYEVIPYATAVDGRTISVPLDLRSAHLVVQDHSVVQLVFGLATPVNTMAVGNYIGQLTASFQK